jgi:cytochrome oxidase Cu insertion factor (SCO1/SenC/PrrC family)
MKNIKGGAGMRKIFLSSLLVAGLLWGGVPVALAQSPSGPVRLPPGLVKMVDKPAPDFSLTLFSGEKVKLKDFRGTVVVLNFWHSA